VRVTDFRPISLIHSFAKILSKLMANRLAPELNNLIDYNQNAFIKKRSIHDNFMLVSQMVKELHRKKIPAMFIKLDISKAFDTVNWSYMLDILSHLGFGPRWRGWTSALWATSSSSLINRMPRQRICHRRGVRQGDPLSLMLFLLAMEPLHLLFQWAQQLGVLNPLQGCCTKFRMSMYADDAAVFINPTPQDLRATRHILKIFGEASGLVANLDKTEYYPIRCHDLDLVQLLGEEHQVSQFPCFYLGLPLHYKRLPKQMILPFVQKIGNRLPGWKRNLLTYSGRELLVKTVLTSMPTHFLIVYKLPAWAKKDIDRFWRSFLWRGEDPDRVKGGYCLVKWRICTRPRKWGGLGIKDLDRFGRVLRLQWLWHNWDVIDRPWKNLIKFHDKTDKALFFASTVINVGNGKNTPFWEGRWLNGVSPKELAPNLYKQACFKSRTVHKELYNMNWIKNLKQVNTEDLIEEFVLLFNTLSEIQLNENADTIFWRWTTSGEYTAASAYEAQFLGACPMFRASSIWCAHTEPKCRFLAWMALLGKIPTADNLMKKSWPCNPSCALCYCEAETNDHILTECNFAEAVWDRIA
jgi:hypothetical protein